MTFPDSVKYGDKYDKLLLIALKKVNREIELLIGQVNKTKAAQEKLTILLANRQNIIGSITTATRESYNAATNGAFAAEFKTSEDYYKQKGIKVKFFDIDINTLVTVVEAKHGRHPIGLNGNFQMIVYIQSCLQIYKH